MSEKFKQILEQAHLEVENPNYEPKSLEDTKIVYKTAAYGTSKSMYYGSTQINNIYYGTGIISTVYQGNNLVFKK